MLVRMNRVSLDSIGAAGFSHSFGALDGDHSAVAERFNAFATLPAGSSLTMLVLASVVPSLVRIPTLRSTAAKELHDTMSVIAKELINRSRHEKDEVRRQAGISIIGALSESSRVC
jgi:hypothetical protein